MTNIIGTYFVARKLIWQPLNNRVRKQLLITFYAFWEAAVLQNNVLSSLKFVKYVHTYLPNEKYVYSKVSLSKSGTMTLDGDSWYRKLG